MSTPFLQESMSFKLMKLEPLCIEKNILIQETPNTSSFDTLGSNDESSPNEVTEQS